MFTNEWRAYIACLAIIQCPILFSRFLLCSAVATAVAVQQSNGIRCEKQVNKVAATLSIIMLYNRTGETVTHAANESRFYAPSIVATYSTQRCALIILSTNKNIIQTIII